MVLAMRKTPGFEFSPSEIIQGVQYPEPGG
jgi:hypothetical protein